MARTAMDGTQYTNQMMVNRRNSSIKAKGSDPMAKGSDPMSSMSSTRLPEDSAQGGDIESNPDAMECVSKLKEMGYTADDVAKAMQDSGNAGGAEATQAAPLQIPGMS